MTPSYNYLSQSLRYKLLLSLTTQNPLNVLVSRFYLIKEDFN